MLTKQGAMHGISDAEPLFLFDIIRKNVATQAFFIVAVCHQ